MGSYNILTNSILRQSQIGEIRNESMDSAAVLASGHNESIDEQANAEYPEVNLFENDQS